MQPLMTDAVFHPTDPITDVPCLLATARGRIDAATRALPALGADAVRVRTEVTMVSPGTELHWIDETHTRPTTYPMSTGYIAVGSIIGVGARVTDRTIGQRVLLLQGHAACHDEAACAAKPVPDGVAAVDAASAILLGISIRGIRAGQVRLGESVAVFGLGPIGLFAAHLAKISGAHPVIGVDPVAKRRAVARELGVDIVIDPATEDVAATVARVTGGERARIVIEATGTAQVIASLPEMTAAFGRVVVLGGVHGAVPLDLYTRFQKSNLTLVGCGSTGPADFPFTEERNQAALLKMIASGMVRPRPALTHLVPWREAPAMYRLLRERKEEAIVVAFDWTAINA
ncbi:MAG: zinc-binding alcohol dehydrogenase [Planctomycetes bacterium]|nr:zinc-binding alcohol dehydrogenase [Planctomycetota bacterium]